jgi:hypothetical protein
MPLITGNACATIRTLNTATTEADGAAEENGKDRSIAMLIVMPVWGWAVLRRLGLHQLLPHSPNKLVRSGNIAGFPRRSDDLRSVTPDESLTTAVVILV